MSAEQRMILEALDRIRRQIVRARHYHKDGMSFEVYLIASDWVIIDTLVADELERRERNLSAR